MGTIQLTQGRVARVCDCHYNLVAGTGKRWQVLDGYARNRDGLKMHRLVTAAKPGQIVDHINGDGLDNRCCNLRIVTAAQNMANRRVNKTSASGYKGVTYDSSMKRKKNWGASIHHEGKRIKIGRYFTPEAAAEAYNQVAAHLKGEYARLNKIERIAS